MEVLRRPIELATDMTTKPRMGAYSPCSGYEEISVVLRRAGEVRQTCLKDPQRKRITSVSSARWIELHQLCTLPSAPRSRSAHKS